MSKLLFAFVEPPSVLFESVKARCGFRGASRFLLPPNPNTGKKGPWLNCGNPAFAATVVCPLTFEEATKLSGASWLARQMLSRMDTLRAFAVLRLMLS